MAKLLALLTMGPEVLAFNPIRGGETHAFMSLITCTEPFIISLSSSQYHQIVIIFQALFI